jgi:signal transduction histidine kinase/ActR/RegA family two-component response regulator
LPIGRCGILGLKPLSRTGEVRVDVKAQLHPGRDFLIAFGVTAVAGAAIFSAPGPGFPVLHTILNTGIALGAVAVSVLFWDLGWRTGETRVRFLAIVFFVAGLLEVLHVIAALEPSSGSEDLNAAVRQLRVATWAPPSYLLPLGTAFVLWRKPTPDTSKLVFALATVAVATGLFALFQALPRYSAPGLLGILRPTLLAVPLLWIPVGITLWRRRQGDRIAHALAYYALAAALAHSLMLYSDQATSKFAMTAHFGVFAGGLFLLLNLVQMGTADTARRMRAEQALQSINEALEVRVASRTAELQSLNEDLRREVSVRQAAEEKALGLHESLRQAYDDLRRTQEAVLEHERLRALGQMASGIAHDINNAISPVAVYVESMLDYETNLSRRAREQLKIIQRAVDDVARTVARMGEFYRKRPAQLEFAPVSVNRTLRNVLDLTRARWSDIAQQRGVVIEATIDATGDDPTVMAIEGELREALVNLVFNAIDAMPGGGRLVLRSGRTNEGARRVFIEVVDSGIGMDDVTRRHCLEPFYTTKGERGSGLGLAIVYGIAQRHGAEIDIESVPGEGTAFRMIFPEVSQPPRPAAAADIERPVQRTRILLVDDDLVLLTSLSEVLELDGHEVRAANGGQQGIDTFLDALEEGQAFPVVITDLGMPHVDGRAVVAAIRAAAPRTAIIMLTGWGQRLIEEGDIPEGVRAVLSKPPRLDDLRRRLAEFDVPTKEKVTS